MASLYCNTPREKESKENMGWFGFGSSSSKSTSSSSPKQTPTNYPQEININSQINYMIKHETLLHIPRCIVSLVEEGEAIELARGDFSLQLISDQNVSLATIVKVGKDLQWPLTKDEPVVKLDAFHYLFTLPMKEGDPLSYGVTFSEKCDKNLLGSLDSFLREHACFSCPSRFKGRNDLDWKEFAPKIESYNSVLARAIAGGTGQIVRGIFMVSNAYTNQVQKGGELILTRTTEENNNKNGKFTNMQSRGNNAAKKDSINRSMKRVRNLSSMTEKMSKAMLDGVGVATGTVMRPLVNSKQGKAFLSMMPGEVLLASLDAVDKIMYAAEAAEKQALHATSRVAARMVSNKFGENAGEATEDVLATAGHCAGTAWNILKIRRAINPTATTSSGVLKNTRRTLKS